MGWMRVCAAWADAQDMLIIRFGDQMNNVAVTDGDKVEAEVRMGYHVDYCPVSELMEYHAQVKDEDVKTLVVPLNILCFGMQLRQNLLCVLS